MISAILDTSVYIRALHFGGRAALLIEYARTKKLRVDVSEPMRKLISTCNYVLPTETLDVIPVEPDNRILECAVTAHSDFIVSEDKDLLRPKEFASIKIVSIGDFFNQIS